MRTRIRGVMCALFASAAVIAAAHPVAAEPITYSETIEDANYATFFDLFDGTRDLTRTRTFGDGTSEIETDDATIVSENALSDNWGTSTALVPMTWQHVFAPTVSVATYLQLDLMLKVIGVDADFPDLVLVEVFPLGTLTVGGTDTESTTIISSELLPDPNGLISSVLADGRLDVMAWPLLLDFMTIRSSTLEVTYVPVPEPTTAVLVLGGLAAGAWRRRRASRVA